jgi:hypothetical protein
MPRAALIDRRPYLLLSLALAIAYFFASDGRVPGLWLIAWKGSCVGVLALYAWDRGRGVDGALIAAVMGLCAAGDVGIEISLELGAFFFGIAHIVAIALYRRNARATTVSSQRLAAFALLVGTPVLTALIAAPVEGWVLATVYALLLGLMAATAWTSRFSRYQVGIGAVLFVVSDLLIFAREAGRIDPSVAEWLVWPLYYIGQFLIVTGVVQRLRGERHAPGAA